VFGVIGEIEFQLDWQGLIFFLSVNLAFNWFVGLIQC